MKPITRLDPPAPDALAEALTWDATILLEEGTGAEPVTLDWSGCEPFASLDLGAGWVLDFTATLRRADD